MKTPANDTTSRRAKLILLNGAADAYGYDRDQPTCDVCGGSPAETREECDEPTCPSLQSMRVDDEKRKYDERTAMLYRQDAKP